VRSGMVVAAGSDRAARVWSLESERLLHTLTGHASKLYACRLTGDGRFAVTGGTDRKAMIWDLHTGYKIRTVACGSICNAVAVSDEGSYFATAHQDKSVRVWDMREGKAVFSTSEAAPAHDGPVCSVRFFPGGHRLLTSSKDDSLCVLDMASSGGAGLGADARECVLKRLRHPDYHAAFNWSGCDLSPGATLVAAGAASGKVFVWRLDTGSAPEGAAPDAVISVVTGSSGGPSGQAQMGGSTAPNKVPVECVGFCPLGGGRLASVDKEGVLRHWRHRAGAEPLGGRARWESR